MTIVYDATRIACHRLRERQKTGGKKELRAKAQATVKPVFRIIQDTREGM
jgi:hypothetical protein